MQQTLSHQAITTAKYQDHWFPLFRHAMFFYGGEAVLTCEQTNIPQEMIPIRLSKYLCFILGSS